MKKLKAGAYYYIKINQNFGTNMGSKVIIVLGRLDEDYDGHFAEFSIMGSDCAVSFDTNLISINYKEVTLEVTE